MSKLIDLTGKRFGRLVVIERAENVKYGTAMWLCKCDCGNPSTVRGAHLRLGDTQSCGCLHNELLSSGRSTHGMSQTPIYGVWCSMISRCTNPNNKGYKNYGGRGITVCESWRSFENFYADMGERPSKDYSIDRIDNDKGYFPNNCRWTSNCEQAKNRRAINTSRTGVKGVGWSRRQKKYQARICDNGNPIHIGYFTTLEEATQARQDAEAKYWGDTI